MKTLDDRTYKKMKYIIRDLLLEKMPLKRPVRREDVEI